MPEEPERDSKEEGVTPGQAAKAIDKVLNGEGTKSDKARALFVLGLTKTEVAELVPMNYSQAHSVWVKEGYVATPRVRANKASMSELRDDPTSGHRRLTNNRALFLTPAQTRYVTQDGHEVVRVDKQSGAECLNCGRTVQFSLKWLGFVHKFSEFEPTGAEDRYT